MKAKRIKLYGAIYFAGLGLINCVGSGIYEEFKWMDLIMLAISILPLLINRKLFLISYGFFAALISFYIGFACTVFAFDPQIEMTLANLLIGYALFFFSLVASCALLYGGLQSSTNEREFSLI